MEENKKLFELADRLKALKDEKYDLDDRLKEVNADVETVQAEMVEIMLSEEIGGFNRGGSQFSLTTAEYPGAVPERKDELYEKLKSAGYGNLFSVNSQTLRGFIGELKSNNDGQLPEWLDGLINENQKQIIRVTRGRKI